MINPSRARVLPSIVKVNPTLLLFLRDPRLASDPIAPRGPVSIKEPEPRNSRQNAVTVPVTPPCPNYFICLFLKAYILYLGV